MHIRKTKIYRFFSSTSLAIWLLGLIALFSLAGTLIPQNKEPAEYIARYGHFVYQMFLRAGLINIYSAWWFVLLLVSLSLNLIICLFNRFSLKMRSLGSLISHISVLVILAGALIGMFWGEKGFIRIKEGECVNSFISKTQPVSLDFSIKLDDFIYEENIDPQEKLLVYSKEGEILAKISPEIGSKSEIAGTPYMVGILRYVSDFVMDISTREVTSRSAQPRNPAIEVELKGKDSIKTFWVFAAYPDLHKQRSEDFRFDYHWVVRRPKDFISKVTVIKNNKEVISKDIRVNFPLKFGGYTFFQSSYDSEYLNWSGLQVVRDPGVVIVYFGFIQLILGLTIIFYVNPFWARKTQKEKVKCFRSI